MEFSQALGYALQALTDPMLLFCLAAGVFLGIYVGAIPGLSVTMATSLLISFTYSWATLPALAAMVGVYIGGGQFIHASDSGVVVASLYSSYWAGNYYGAGRILVD